MHTLRDFVGPETKTISEGPPHTSCPDRIYLLSAPLRITTSVLLPPLMSRKKGLPDALPEVESPRACEQLPGMRTVLEELARSPVRPEDGSELEM